MNAPSQINKETSACNILNFEPVKLQEDDRSSTKECNRKKGCASSFVNLISIRGDTFISLSFLAQIFSAGFSSKPSKLFGGKN